ncbi:putative amidase family protein [Phaeoacremonium minimum UCRPA7]|uniref:Putative amidase family protein n=1 Tax=Phaeoacremonium minimum (strain UCR-PA7) TaxID=1286976 RepID=R8BQ06_PHAM7|nr:putative amidase family protein [Phaeoacremonium minimum UCRPA7]EOO01360.1 putative amidase family protein [Phaeoacremonium minimum UCRPA7]
MATPSTQELLALDAGEFRIRIENGELSIAGLISAIIQHVKQQNKDGLRLRAVLYPAPEDVLVEQAKQQDAQHREGRAALGLLHGIPVVLKDCIATAPALGMKTSAGSYALQEAKIAANAPIVERLLAAGAIIIGKSNLSEFCAYKGEGLIDGYSPVGGQTKSPYIRGDINLDEGDLSPSSPGGSSTGSAVSVSAGFSLVGIGTENDGSIVQPASRQALFALKPTLGLITAEGCWRVAASCDTPGAMARSVRDVALATEAMLDESTRAKLPEGGYGSFLNASFDGMRIGFVDPALWRFPPDLWVPSDDAKEQHDKAYRSAMKRVEELGAKVVYPVSLPSYKELEVNAFENVQAAQDFFDGYVDAKSKIRSLADVIQYNKDHADQSLPKSE